MIFLFIILGIFLLLVIVVVLSREPELINDDNPYIHPEKKDVLPEDMRAFVVEANKPKIRIGFYGRFLKRVFDIILSFFGLVLLSPIFLVLCIAVIIDDPGPVFFKQKRIGRGKCYFYLHKFRSMKMSTPHDMPTHMLDNPNQYITRVGKFLRKSSLDELPQIWDIFRGKMSIIGPRPALWNQADLVFEREKYAANDVAPGLTGWAQINGRDELEISMKAKFDGDYIKDISFLFDIKCFIGTVLSVIKHEGVVEGGTGEIHKKEVHQ